MHRDKDLQQRLLGAGVLFACAIALIPLLLKDQNPLVKNSSNPEGTFSSYTFDKQTLKPSLIQSPRTQQTAAISPTASQNQDSQTRAWIVHVANYPEKVDALVLCKRLEWRGYNSFVEIATDSSEAMFRVYVGPRLERAKAKALKKDLQRNLGLKGNLYPYL